MSALIDDVLDFARGRLGSGVAIDRAPLSLQPALEHVVYELQSSHPDRAIDAEFALAEAVHCDGGRIAQLFSNLLGNALTHGASDSPIRVRAATRNHVFELSVANAGEPIPAAAMAKLFQPFYRGAVRRSLQGLGLGLFIASEIARAHGGTLTVDSTGQETRFTFRMPLR
jgi:phosphoserine phosphatase RsbU/P